MEPAELQSGSPSATLDLLMVHVMRTRMVPQTKHKYKKKYEKYRNIKGEEKTWVKLSYF